jgi:hypothetical protein
MADWKQLARKTILADGKIDDDEVKVLRKELYADGKIDKAEVEFLIALRNEAQKRAKGGPINANFERLFFKAMADKVLDNGIISAAEAKWLRTMLYADKKIDDNEKKFLKDLKKNATKISPAFEALYAECVGK